MTFYAQLNLVPNGDFEEYEFCPDLNNHFLYTTGKYWTSPTSASPDLCHSCCTEYEPTLQCYSFSVPENFYGYQPAHSGNAYSAIACQQNIDGTQVYMEYIQIELKQTLKAETLYEVSFFVHNPKIFCINSIGALFTSSELHLNTMETISLSPQITSDPEVFFCDTTKWYEVKQFYRAQGDERFLTIGVFKRLPEMKLIHLEGWVPDITTLWGMLYIDDVTVVEKGIEPANIFTPNGDGNNDKYKLDLEIMGVTKATILNRWGNVILEEEHFLNWDGTFEGAECTDGIYFLKLDFEDKSLSRTIQLIR